MALAQPDARAVEMDGVAISYRELEERSNRLAHALRKRGARPGVYVGICLSRSIDLVVALMGVAKSGAAYVPLDPQYPQDRLEFMLSDAAAIVVVTERRHAPLFKAELLVVDGDGATELAAQSHERLPRLSGPSDVCYAIFTSGSTGIPKGVVLSHRAVVNTFDWVTRTFGLVPGDRLLFVTSPCFDLSVYDTFGALGAGATVVVASDQRLKDPETLARAIVDQRITVWDSAPAALQRLTSFFPKRGTETALRLVMLSGDWIPLTLPDAVRSAFPKARVMSLGGATEAAIWSNWYPIGAIDPRWNSVPYGRPIQNSWYHVLDRRMQPVPVGVPGDLYIGGVCLADGYLNRAELTAERFVQDPFRPGQRLYKTGDLARYFEDGELEFLGRADFQVKIRGFRVEMGEVEAAIMALPGVREAVCAAYSDASGVKSLAAYVVAKDGEKLEEEAIKSALARKLPDFMVPSQVLLLAAMPISSNGKLDRKALPNPTARTSADTYVAPSSPLESQMVEVWEELLQRKPIGIRDDFFKLGGHSLLAVMLVSRVKTQMGIELPLSRVLEHPTIESLVASLEAPMSARARRKHLVVLNGKGSRPPLFLLPGAGGYSFVYQNLPTLLGPEQPVFALQAIGAEGDGDVVDHSIEEMAQIYEPEIVDVCPEGPLVLAGYSFGVLVAYEVLRRLRAKGRDVQMLISLDGYAPGFPTLLPWPSRALAHLNELVNGDKKRRKAYLTARFQNVRRRVLQRLGRDDHESADIPFADPELSERLGKLWASLWRARLRYAPSGAEPVKLLLIKSSIPERWVGNKMDCPLYGWDSYVTGSIATVTVPGEHLSLFEPGTQRLIADAIALHTGLRSSRES
jgi:amino acid adenylation domain-containing protein